MTKCLSFISENIYVHFILCILQSMKFTPKICSCAENRNCIFSVVNKYVYLLTWSYILSPFFSQKECNSCSYFDQHGGNRQRGRADIDASKIEWPSYWSRISWNSGFLWLSNYSKYVFIVCLMLKRFQCKTIARILGRIMWILMVPFKPIIISNKQYFNYFKMIIRIWLM